MNKRMNGYIIHKDKGISRLRDLLCDEYGYLYIEDENNRIVREGNKKRMSEWICDEYGYR